MESADIPLQETAIHVLYREAPIRALSVGLVAIAAVVFSLSVARSRNEERRDEPQPVPGRVPAATGINLDAIRNAGY